MRDTHDYGILELADIWEANRRRRNWFKRARRLFKTVQNEDNLEALPGSYKKYCAARRNKTLTAQS